MKFIAAISAILAAVNGACEAGGDMSCKGDKVCVYRYTADVANPKSRAYTNLLRKDKTVAKGGEKY